MRLSRQGGSHDASRPGSDAPPRVDAPEVGIGVRLVALIVTSAAVAFLLPRPYRDSRGYNAAPTP
jgi:hypothetical protein